MFIIFQILVHLVEMLGNEVCPYNYECVIVTKQVTQRKLKKLEKDYQIFLEQQALLEDPVVRLEVSHCLLCTISNGKSHE